MQDFVHYISERLIERRYEIAERIAKRQNRDDVIENTGIVPEELRESRAARVKMYAECLSLDMDKALPIVAAESQETGKVAVKLGISLELGLESSKFHRIVIRDVTREEVKKADIPLDAAFDLISILDDLLDQSVYSFSLAFVEHHKNSIDMAKEALHELSVPVVPISTGIGVLPVIGAIDTHRAKFLMEVSLRRSVEMQLKYLIIDLSGVPIIDTMVAQELFKILQGLRLLGVKVALAGIRPEIAQTMVNLGIEFKDVPTRASLQQALLSIDVRCEEITA